MREKLNYLQCVLMSFWASLEKISNIAKAVPVALKTRDLINGLCVDAFIDYMIVV